MQGQIEELNFKADFEVPREHEQMYNSERIAETGLTSAKARTAAMPGIIRGSAVDQTKEYDLQREALARQQSTLEQILQTSRYLTHEQRVQLETQVEGLKVEQDRLKIAGGIAKASARYMTSETGNIEGSVNPTLALIRGAGGGAATTASLALLGATESNISGKQKQLAELKSLGLDDDSPEVQKVRRELAGMTIQREQQQRGLAVVPMAASDRARKSTLGAQEAFYEAGYGSFGDIRGNLLGQVHMSEKRVEELSANRQKLIAAGKWTEAMEADFTEARNQAALEGLGAAEKYSFGWDQRLISEAYNMPAHGRLFMSRYTKREAAAAGLYHRAFGGSESQTRSMREMYPAFARMMGSGDARNFQDSAIGGASRRASSVIDVNIRIDDPSGRIRDNSIQVVNQKTSSDQNVNVTAGKRVSG